MLLYLWSKDNKDLSYRQGMNEILAILVYAFHCEMIEDAIVEGQEPIDFTKPLTPIQI